MLKKKIQTHEILTFTILTLPIIHLAYTPKCLQFLLGITFFQIEIKGNAYALFFFFSFFVLFCLGVGVHGAACNNGQYENGEL